MTIKMNKSFKKVIAREGLIIISILLACLGLFLADIYLESTQKRIYSFEELESKHVFKSLVPSQDNGFDINTAKPAGFSLSKDVFSKLALDKLLERRELYRRKKGRFLDELPPNDQRRELLDASYGEITKYNEEVKRADSLLSTYSDQQLAIVANVDLKKLDKLIPIEFDALMASLFLIFFVYPIYLLVRFVIWAIKTLREK